MHAQWTPVSYAITYNLNGGTNGANPASYTVESPAVTLAPATRTDYSFGGWYAASDLSGDAVAAIPAGSTGNKTFYAKWLPPITFTIILWADEDGNILVSDEEATISKTASGDYSSSFTVTVADAYAVMQWHVESFPLGGTAQALDIRAADYHVGTYTLGVTVSKDGAVYSRNIRFTVTN
jgi:uncharacterized repeat protein (TIGR02543 family)